MTKQNSAYIRKQRRTARTRSSIRGAAYPRLSVHRTNQHIYAQIINDTKHQTIVAASDLTVKEKKTKVEVAQLVGKTLAEQARKAKVTKVVFDRGSFKYHGRVKALADAARENGLQF